LFVKCHLKLNIVIDIDIENVPKIILN